MGRLRVDDVETRLRAARDGRGMAQLLSYQVADDLAAGKLVRLLQAWEVPPLPVHLVTKGRAHRAPKIDAFLDFAAKRLQGCRCRPLITQLLRLPEPLGDFGSPRRRV